MDRIWQDPHITRPWWESSVRARRRRPPKWLLTARGRLKRPHKGFADLILCPTCGRTLERSPSGVLCAEHTRLIPLPELYRRVSARWDEIRPRAGGEAVFRRLVLLIEWRQRRPDLA